MRLLLRLEGKAYSITLQQNMMRSTYIVHPSSWLLLFNWSIDVDYPAEP